MYEGFSYDFWEVPTIQSRSYSLEARHPHPSDCLWSYCNQCRVPRQNWSQGVSEFLDNGILKVDNVRLKFFSPRPGIELNCDLWHPPISKTVKSLDNTRCQWATSLTWVTLANIEVFFPISDMHFIHICPTQPSGAMILTNLLLFYVRKLSCKFQLI
jgi:hypothetical protein